MKFDGFGLKVLVSVAMLWGMPVDVKAAETRQPKAEVFSFRPLENTVTAPHLKTMPVLEPLSTQITAYEPSDRAYQLTVAQAAGQALSQAARQAEADSLFQQGNEAFDISQYQLALELWQLALGLYRALNDRQGEANSLNNLGYTWEKQGHPEIAAIFYKSSINIYETIRADITGLEQDLQNTYIDSVEQPYRRLVEIFLGQGRILEVQQVLELLKVEELSEFTRATYSNGELLYDPIEQPIAGAHGTLINLGTKVHACNPNCDQTLYNQKFALQQAFDETISTFENHIRNNLAEDDIFYDPDYLASDTFDIVNAQDGTVFIYPIVLEDTLWILWTAAGGIVGRVEVPGVTQSDLSRAIVRFRELLDRPDSQSLADLKIVGKQLHGWLIEPLSKELEVNNVQHLVFAQDRATRYIPMSALYDGEQFLLENYTISVVLSAVLTDTSDRLGSVENTNILGLGLEQSINGFSPLPNVREELETVIKEHDEDTTGLYPGSVLINEDFTFKALSEQVRPYRILHIATHAEFSAGIEDSFYILSGTGEEITLDQIGSLALEFYNLHLVVLSACQTALSYELISFFLIQNAAEAVLATLWRIDDAGTSLLMQRFYELLATGGLTKAEALQQAQLSLLNQEESLDQRFETLGLERGLANANAPASTPATLGHPYYWAPFILVGNSL